MRSTLPRAVILLGLTSFFTDASSDLIFPLLPAFLAARFAAAPLILGTMEGVAELVAASLKWWAGRAADRAARLRPLVLFGYSVSAVARPLMALVTAVWHPVVVRAFDRVGKGIRSAPRDALIASWVRPEERGRAFGLHRGMDHAGAAAGAGLAALLLWQGLRYETIFALAAIPGVLGVAMLVLVKEPPARSAPSLAALPQGPLPRGFGRVLLPLFVFALANSSDAFVLLLLVEQGAAREILPLAWLGLHLVKAVISAPAGALADRLGHRRVLGWGWALYAVCYALLAVSPSWQWTLVILAFYGAHHALTEGAEKALIANAVPDSCRGRAFGLYHAGVGGSALVAGLLFGLLWKWGSSGAAFSLGAGLASLAVLLLWAPTVPAGRAPAERR